MRMKPLLISSVDRGEVHDTCGFSSVVPNQMVGRLRREPDLERSLTKWVQRGGLAARQRLFVRRSLAGTYGDAPPGKLRQHAINRLRCHYPIGRELSSGDGDDAPGTGYDG